MTQCSATTQNLAIVGILALLVLGAGCIFIGAAALAGRAKDGEPKPPYEGDAGDEQGDLRLTRGMRIPSDTQPLYGLPSVHVQDFDDWLAMVEPPSVHQN